MEGWTRCLESSTASVLREALSSASPPQVLEQLLSVSGAPRSRTARAEGLTNTGIEGLRSSLADEFIQDLLSPVPWGFQSRGPEVLKVQLAPVLVQRTVRWVHLRLLPILSPYSRRLSEKVIHRAYSALSGPPEDETMTRIADNFFESIMRSRAIFGHGVRGLATDPQPLSSSEFQDSPFSQAQKRSSEGLETNGSHKRPKVEDLHESAQQRTASQPVQAEGSEGLERERSFAEGGGPEGTGTEELKNLGAEEQATLRRLATAIKATLSRNA
mmetsp:Transcript_19209/g.29994  ORF Transcript_19209/g.29994 Transcript_19209/m.29994 type:complete len:272 (-) Transcript_19209:1272-2087(-)